MSAGPARSSTVDDDECHSPGVRSATAATDLGGREADGHHPGGNGSDQIPTSSRRTTLAMVGGLCLLIVPLVVALVALRRPQWFPILDLAMTELRVRDVGTRQTPLIGLPGRIGVLGPEQGSHPGPLSFWLLAPTYRLFGSTAWAMQVATAVLHAAAMAVALWLANRRRGLAGVLGVAAVLAVLTHAYGASTLTEAWNPYMPLLWWVVVLLGVWSVLDGDLVGLPIVVAAGTFCVQTHVPYALLVGGMGALALAATVAAHLRAGGEPGERRRIVAWLLAATAIGLVLWAPPLVDQIRRQPGNISLLLDHFGSPPEESVGLVRGLEMTLLHLDPWRLLTGQHADTGSLVGASTAPRGSLLPGAAMLGVWLAALAGATVLRHRLLLRLHLVVGVALALAAVSISRIFGQLWYYLMTWAWGITALMILAACWSFAALVAARCEGGARVRLDRIGAAALAGIVVSFTMWFAVDATAVEVPAEPLSDTMASIVPPTIDALDPDGRYLVTWSDTLYIGAQGIALVNELDRAGFDVGTVEAWGVPVGKHRIRQPADATALVHLANGIHVDTWRARPGAEVIAEIDPRTPDEVVEYDRLHDEVIAELRAAGFEQERLDEVTENLFSVAIDPRVPEGTQDKLTRLHDMGLPTAVFLAPADAGG